MNAYERYGRAMVKKEIAEGEINRAVKEIQEELSKVNTLVNKKEN